MKKEFSKLSKIFITLLMLVTCVQHITVFAEDETGDSGEEGIMLTATKYDGIYTITVGESKTINGIDSESGYEWWWHIESDDKSSGKEHPEYIDNPYGEITSYDKGNAVVKGKKAGTFTVCHRYYIKDDVHHKYGYYYQHYLINVVDPNSANFETSITNASVAYYAWHNADDTSNVILNNVENGNLTIQDYTTTENAGYVLFFVKPNDNYLITGLGSNGNDGNIYPLTATNLGTVYNYPGLANVVNKAKEAGYVACFGYNNGVNEVLNASFTVNGQQPTVSVSAEATERANEVGDQVTIAVTVTPQVLDKTSVKSISITSAIVNGETIDKANISDLTKTEDGKYTGTITYTVSESAFNAGNVSLSVNTSTEYVVNAATVGETALTLNSTVTGSASTTLDILNKGKVSYEFVSGTTGRELPDAVTDLKPSDENEYFVGRTVNVSDSVRVDQTVEVNEGVWTFTGWDKSSATMTQGGVTFTGTWSFREKKGTAGYYLSLKDASWGETTPTGITAVQDGDKTKYYYDKKLDTGEKFTVVSEVPSAEGYLFIGWLDKDRGSQVAAIRKAEDEVTYIYDDSKKSHTYTLDALWANISVTGYAGTYDGQEHTISDGVLTINEGTELDDKYKKLAKDLITVSEGSKILYSTDKETWSETKPTFTDVGEYTVYAKEDVKVGENPVTLVGQATVVIAPKEVTVSAVNASKVYGADDPDWTKVTATVSGLLGEDTVSYSVTRTEGEDVGKYDIIPSGDKLQGNYKVTYNNATFEITERDEIVITPELTGDSAKKVYDGSALTSGAIVNITEGTTVSYSTDGGKTWKTEKPSITNVEKLEVIAKTEKKNYKTKTVTYTLEVTPASLKVVTNSATKTYDGKALTAKGTVTGLVNNETVTFTVTGSQTNVGKSDNTYTLDWNGSAKKDNYTVSSTLGKLEVVSKEGSKSSSKSTGGWDDGSPFTTDTCGNVFDRWGNKIYEAKGCNVGGYNLVRTSVED